MVSRHIKTEIKTQTIKKYLWVIKGFVTLVGTIGRWSEAQDCRDWLVQLINVRPRKDKSRLDRGTRVRAYIFYIYMYVCVGGEGEGDVYTGIAPYNE